MKKYIFHRPACEGANKPGTIVKYINRDKDKTGWDCRVSVSQEIMSALTVSDNLLTNKAVCKNAPPH